MSWLRWDDVFLAFRTVQLKITAFERSSQVKIIKITIAFQVAYKIESWNTAVRRFSFFTTHRTTDFLKVFSRLLVSDTDFLSL